MYYGTVPIKRMYTEGTVLVKPAVAVCTHGKNHLLGGNIDSLVYNVRMVSTKSCATFWASIKFCYKKYVIRK